MSVSCYPVVNAVQQLGGQQIPDPQKAPCTAKITRSPKSRRRADEYFLVTSRSGIHPDHRVNALQLRVPAQDLGSKAALEGSKPQGMLPLVPQHERQARRTESACTVIQQQRGAGCHPYAQDFPSSTRLLLARPSAVLLSADGLVSP